MHSFNSSPRGPAGQPDRDANPAAAYYPDATWQHRTPSESGVSPDLLKQAIDFAVAGETKAPRDLVMNHYQTFGREPFGYAIGPIRERGDPTGIIIRNGYIVAEWGDPLRVDMTHSVTKSFLSSVVGIAIERGMIRSVDDAVRDYVPPIQLYAPPTTTNKSDRLNTPDLMLPFESPHNRTITWDNLLRQTSDWEGTLWGKPDWADRPSQNPAEWRTRKRAQPGTTYEYNDVRVNVLALAATNVWRRPLPEVLRDNVMDPIGASASWRWFGYDNAWITLDGRPVQVVSGGGHWGGGMFINAWDMARFGLLTLRRGMWGDKRILSEAWVKMALTPTAPEPTYGFMNWFLNTDRKWMPSAPPNAFGHVGNGTNLVFVSPDQDLVAVVRWIDNSSIDAFLGKLLGAVVK